MPQGDSEVSKVRAAYLLDPSVSTEQYARLIEAADATDRAREAAAELAETERHTSSSSGKLDPHEVVVKLADGWSLASGVYDPDDPNAPSSGEYVSLRTPEGMEVLYWDWTEWQEDPILVMGAIINSAAGLFRDASELRKQ